MCDVSHVMYVSSMYLYQFVSWTGLLIVCEVCTVLVGKQGAGFWDMLTYGCAFAVALPDFQG